MSRSRIMGIDIARALAVFGMIIVNFKVVIGDEGWSWVEAAAQLLEGKAAATFVVLAGLGIALMTNKAINSQDELRIKRIRLRLVRRALFLLIIGLSYLPIWPADILHFYGVYMLILLFYLRSNARWLLVSAAGFILLYPVVLSILDYESGWNFATLTYEGFWTWKGFFLNLFINGFHPVLPWVSFMLIGYWLGRQDLQDSHFLKRVLWYNAAIFIVLQVISWLGKSFLPGGDLFWSTSPMPPLPMYMMSGVSFALVLITTCIFIGNRWQEVGLWQALSKTGKLSLTFYVAHVVLGMGLMEGCFPRMLGQFSIQFSLFYALLFSLGCVAFAVFWMKYRSSGPLEWLMRKLTG